MHLSSTGSLTAIEVFKSNSIHQQVVQAFVHCYLIENLANYQKKSKPPKKRLQGNCCISFCIQGTFCDTVPLTLPNPAGFDGDIKVFWDSSRSHRISYTNSCFIRSSYDFNCHFCKNDLTFSASPLSRRYIGFSPSGTWTPFFGTNVIRNSPK